MLDLVFDKNVFIWMKLRSDLNLDDFYLNCDLFAKI